MVALAIGLQHAGHRGTLVTSPTFVDWIRSYGVEVCPVHFNPQEVLQRPEMQAFMQKGGNPLRVLRNMRQELGRALGARALR